MRTASISMMPLSSLPMTIMAAMLLMWSSTNFAVARGEYFEQIRELQQQQQQQNMKMNQEIGRPVKLGIVSGSYDSEFFQQVEVGWNSGCEIVKQKHAEEFGDAADAASAVECIYSGTNWTLYANTVEQDGYYTHGCTWQMDTMVEDDPDIDAMTVACIYDQDRQDVIPTWTTASNNGQRPLVAFDGVPPPDFPVKIESYIGTDNRFLGRTLARLLKQLRPEGGTYGLIYHNDHKERSEGFREEIQKYTGREGKPQWFEIQDRYGFQDFENPLNDLTHHRLDEVMQDLALQEPTAIIFLYQTPMRRENYTNFIDEFTRPRNVTVIGTDGSDYQLNYLSRRYVNGLVGQLPFDMGQYAAREMYELVMDRRRKKYELDVTSSGITTNVTAQDGQPRHIDEDSFVDEVHQIEIIPTNLVAYNLIPLELPPLQIDQSLLGNLVLIGYICFGLVAVCGLCAIGWTFYNREQTVVRASQPGFLMMTATGVLIMCSTLIPLSFGDNGRPEEMSQTYATGICMSIPWLAFTGFTVTFSALFSKTWRINRVFESSDQFRRTQVSVRDVMLPFVVLLSLNFVVLILWTAIDPLVYERKFLRGTDYWNREYESIGTCTSENSAAFLAPLSFINFFVLIIACWQAWKARNIKTEFSESKYIGLAVFSMTQAFLTGIPIVAIVREIPEAFYLVLTFLIFILSVILLALIFIPKMSMQHIYSKMSVATQRRHLKQSVRQSSVGHGRSSHSSKLQRESNDIMDAAKVAQQQYEEAKARKNARGNTDSNESSIDSGFGSSDPMIQSGLIQPTREKSVGFSKTKHTHRYHDSAELCPSDITMACPPVSLSTAVSIFDLLTSSELKTLLRDNGIVIQEELGSPDPEQRRKTLVANVAGLLVDRSHQKCDTITPITEMKGSTSTIENLGPRRGESNMESIVEDDIDNTTESLPENPVPAKSTTSDASTSEKTEGTIDETVTEREVDNPRPATYSEQSTSIVEA
mmetsp:Transcript_42300/g.101851  ORF Transcript_42300/g.101851 Transcript_42300/m.101851 type:complete len:984 (+) Transcript_42300:2049-5000(+)